MIGGHTCKHAHETRLKDAIAIGLVDGKAWPQQHWA
jgi:hypothetical protein